MFGNPYVRIVWARKWLALALFVLVAGAGIAYTLHLPRQYVAETTLILEMRIDPALGAMAPALAAPSYMATQVEVLRSDPVASRAVKILGVERSADAVAQWREATQAKIPLDRYFADVLERNLSVEPLRGSNVLQLSFSSQDPVFAQAAANAFAQAYMDVSVELRIAPARQSAQFLEEQAKTLRSKLEEAQATLSKYQQAHGIVVSDERLDQESARYNALIAQLAIAQAEQVDTATRQRYTGTDTSPDVLQSPSVMAIKSELGAAQTKLTDLASIVGSNHPARLQLEAQIADLKQQLAAEVRRVAGGASTSNRGSGQKVGELQAMVEMQKKQLLDLRSDRDQIAVYVRDVEAAQRAYDAVSQRLGQLNLEGQNNQANTRLLSPATEPLEPTRTKRLQGILLSVFGGLLLAAGAAIGLESLDRRVRSVADLRAAGGNVPVIGVLRPAGSKAPVFRTLSAAAVPAGRAGTLALGEWGPRR